MIKPILNDIVPRIIKDLNYSAAENRIFEISDTASRVPYCGVTNSFTMNVMMVHIYPLKLPKSSPPTQPLKKSISPPPPSHPSLPTHLKKPNQKKRDQPPPPQRCPPTPPPSSPSPPNSSSKSFITSPPPQFPPSCASADEPTISSHPSGNTTAGPNSDTGAWSRGRGWMWIGRGCSGRGRGWMMG